MTSAMAGAGAVEHSVEAASEPEARWPLLAFLSAAVLLALGTWFSGTAVAPTLAREWGIDTLGVASLTVAVQVGFAAGSALTLQTTAGFLLTAVTILGVSFSTRPMRAAGGWPSRSSRSARRSASRRCGGCGDGRTP
jgi:hypothetical protein